MSWPAALCCVAALASTAGGELQFESTAPSIVPINQPRNPLKPDELEASNNHCLPVLSNLMRTFSSDCQQRADERTLDSWTGQLGHVLRLQSAGPDWARATKETCKNQADRRHCRTLMGAVSRCDIVAGLKAATDLQNDKQRCDRIAEIAVQPVLSNAPLLFGQQAGGQGQPANPLATLLGVQPRVRQQLPLQQGQLAPVNTLGFVQQPQQQPLLNSISSWIGSEVASGLLRNFLAG